MKGKVVRTSKINDGEALPWAMLRELFEDQWVEIVDVEWEPKGLYPRRARVKNFSPDRASLVESLSRSKNRRDSAVVYMGTSSSQCI